MSLQALETFPSSSANCSKDSFLLVLCENVVIWVLRIVGGLAITNLSRRPGWLRYQPLRYATGLPARQLSEKYETTSSIPWIAAVESPRGSVLIAGKEIVN